MKILSTLLTAVFVWGIITPTSFAIPQTRCDVGVDRKIGEFVEGEKGWLQKLADAVHSGDGVKVSLGESVKDLRTLRCNLESICQAIDFASQPENAKKIEEEKGVNYEAECFLATDVTTTYEKKDFFGDEAICSFPSQQNLGHVTEINRIKQMCEEKISVNFIGAQSFMATTYSQVSQQDEANYYSAKILSITDRLKNMGDDLQMLNVYIRRVYESIFCSCRKS